MFTRCNITANSVTFRALWGLYVSHFHSAELFGIIFSFQEIVCGTFTTSVYFLISLFSLCSKYDRFPLELNSYQIEEMLFHLLIIEICWWTFHSFFNLDRRVNLRKIWLLVYPTHVLNCIENIQQPEHHNWKLYSDMLK